MPEPPRRRAPLASVATRRLQGLGPLADRGPNTLAFFLDVDGTLLDFAPTPSAVRVPPATADLLDRLFAASGGAVALISGRPIADLDRLFGHHELPAAGQHGAEQRDPRGEHTLAPLADGPRTLLHAEAQRVRAAHPQLLVEEKDLSLAFHYRRCPALAGLARRLALALAARAPGIFVVQHGHFVEEVRASATDKGAAVRRFMLDAPFAGRLPVFLGDDVTDEDGFRAINALGGVSIKVGAGATCAHWRLRDPAAVADWLRAVLEQRDATP